MNAAQRFAIATIMAFSFLAGAAFVLLFVALNQCTTPATSSEPVRVGSSAEGMSIIDRHGDLYTFTWAQIEDCTIVPVEMRGPVCPPTTKGTTR